MKRLLSVLYATLVLLLAAATFVEQARGTEFVERHIYHTAWFCCLWGALAVAAAAVLIRPALRRRFPMLLFHGSFLLILAGAMITFGTGRRGQVHLRPGIGVAAFVDRDTGQEVSLPFVVRLDSFRVEYYPGTEAAADYVSYLSLALPGGPLTERRVSMNRILRVQGYRFYQSSFDPDGEGSWLGVNHDPWGTPVTYAGYALLGLSMLAVLCSRRAGFRRLLAHPLLRRGGLFCLLLWAGLGGNGQAREVGGGLLPVLNRQQADSLARCQVVYADRVAPLNTLARDFVQKLYGRPAYKGLSAEQVLGGWLLYPEAWSREPMIEVKDARLRRLLGLETPYARLSDLFDGAHYRLRDYWQGGRGTDTRLSKAVLEVDEKVGLLLMLRDGLLLRPLPDDGSVEPLSACRVEAELLYNRLPFVRVLFMANLAAGLLSFLLLLGRVVGDGRSGRWARGVWRGLEWVLLLAASFHLCGYVLRWYVGGRVPLSNGYETMLFMALCILVLACLLVRRFPFVLPFGFLLSGCALLVAHIGQLNPQITPLMPVLVSPWLSAHVSFIMMAYALLSFLVLNGVLALFLLWRRRRGGGSGVDGRVEQLTLLSRLLLYPAVFLLGAGIFLGAVWANVSWGRYWAWDPKEVWALVTFMVYGVAFHGGCLPVFRRPGFFHAWMVLAFLAVLMTYFGVNYFLGGMHSYAGG